MSYQEALIVVFWANEMRKRLGGLINEEQSLLNTAESVIENHRNIPQTIGQAKMTAGR